MPLGGMIDYTYPSGIDNYTGYAEISLGDLLSAPDAAARQVVSNVRHNILPFTVSVTAFEFSQKMARKILSKPINKVNNLIFTGEKAPLRGMGVRI